MTASIPRSRKGSTVPSGSASALHAPEPHDITITRELHAFVEAIDHVLTEMETA
jgi:hypothetical protein